MVSGCRNPGGRPRLYLSIRRARPRRSAYRHGYGRTRWRLSPVSASVSPTVLAREGIEVELRTTAGSAENLELLLGDSGVDLAFVQGGVADPSMAEQLETMGTMYLEPLWLLVRAEDMGMDGFRQICTGVRTAIGPEGSGTRDPRAHETAVRQRHRHRGSDVPGASDRQNLPQAFARRRESTRHSSSGRRRLKP